MAKIEKKYITAELEDGDVLEDMRVTMQDQIAYSRTARANKWATDDTPLSNSFIGWHAAKRTGQLPAGVSFEDWRDRVCVDLAVSGDDDETAEVDPT